MQDRCELCGREGVETTEHHLVPREEGGKNMPTARLCIPCHKQIHALYSNRELAVKLYTIERLQKDEKIKKYLDWIRKKPATHIASIKKSRERRTKGK